MATNEITTKMSEQTQVNAADVEVPFQVMTKDLKKVKQGKRLVEFNCKKKEELAQKAKAKESKPKQKCYGLNLGLS